eukprot:6072177-Amphidinium_carterae.1
MQRQLDPDPACLIRNCKLRACCAHMCACRCGRQLAESRYSQSATLLVLEGVSDAEDRVVLGSLKQGFHPAFGGVACRKQPDRITGGAGLKRLIAPTLLEQLS